MHQGRFPVGKAKPMSHMQALCADPTQMCAPGSPKRPTGAMRPFSGSPTPRGVDTATRLRALLDQQIAETDQLYNLLCTLNLPILHLCPAMRLRAFTPAAARVFDLRAMDLGMRIEFRRPTNPLVEVTEVRRAGRIWKCRILPHDTFPETTGGLMMILLALLPVAGDKRPQAAEDGALTPRQQQVMDLVLAGHPSKNIAADLKISQRTVENHRAAIMRRTGATSLPALARMAVGAAGGGDHKQRLGETHDPRALPLPLAFQSP